MKRVDHLTKDLESHDERANAILEEMRSEFTGKMTMYDVEMKSVKETLQNERLEHKQAMEKLATQKDEQFSRALNLSQAQVAQLTQELNQLQARHRHFGSVVGLKGTKVEQQLRAQIAYYEAQLTDADETLESVKKTYSSTNGVLMREVESLLTKLNESGQRERKSEEERKVTSAKLVAEIEKNTKQHEQFMKMTRVWSTKYTFIIHCVYYSFPKRSYYLRVYPSLLLLLDYYVLILMNLGDECIRTSIGTE